MTETWISAENAWVIWAILTTGTAASILLEQKTTWGARISGPVIALLLGMAFSNTRCLPTASVSYDLITDYLVPIAIPLLLFRANITQIVRESGTMFKAFHVATVGTILGGFLAGFIFRGQFPRVPETAGIMAASYIGGAVNFVAVARTYQVEAGLTNPLMVADNFIMAGIFAALLVMAGSRFFRRHFPHPHSLEGDRTDSRELAARHWKPKEVSLLDLALAMGIACLIAAVSMKLTDFLKGRIDSRVLQSIIANPYVAITLLTAGASTLFHRWMEKIRGAEDIGMYLLYLFFFVIGLQADLIQVIKTVPILFLFCLTIALTNLVFTMLAGKALKLNLEELLLSVNATLGGAPSAAAMAISRGWSHLVLPGLLAGVWGYAIGTFLGILVAEALQRLL